jgi:hypothetical protein
MKFNRKILFFAMITAFFLVLLFALDQEMNFEEPGKINYENVPSYQPVSNYAIYVSQDICEGCHISDKSFVPQALSIEPHKNGGFYCLKCHIISHEIHPINMNVTCEKCHGSDPSKPVVANKNMTCNNCHGYPDPLLPSNGNIIMIHRQRGISCNNCHADRCVKCHDKILDTQRWEKRQAHLRAILMTS